jgi:hypothetical protein
MTGDKLSRGTSPGGDNRDTPIGGVSRPSRHSPVGDVPVPQPCPCHLAGQRQAFALMVEYLLELIDQIDGDPDLEIADEPEWGGDEADAGWIEWHTMHGPQARGATIAGGHEDAEEDDPAEDDDPGGGNVTDEPHDDESEDGI